MRELNVNEIEEVNGGVRSIVWSIIYDGLKYVATELIDYEGYGAHVNGGNIGTRP